MAVYSLGRRRVIALLVLSSLLLITLDVRGNAVIDKLRSAFSLVLSPFDRAARTVSKPIENAWRGINDYDRLRRENEALAAQVASQRGAAIEARAAILEYQDLLALNHLTAASSYPTVTAQVQGQRASNYSSIIEIDRGTSDGIAVGMPVVNGAGLVGKITAVSRSSAKVLLVTDPSFNIGVKVLTAFDPNYPDVPVRLDPGGGIFQNSTTSTLPLVTEPPTSTSTTTTTSTTVVGPPSSSIPGEVPVATNPDGSPVDSVPIDDTSSSSSSSSTTTTILTVVKETGTLTGQGPGKPLIIRFVDSTASNKLIDSTVQTAGGIRSIAPAGLPIGVVTGVKAQSGESVPLIEVQPVAGDLTTLNFLTVLLYQPSQS